MPEENNAQSGQPAESQDESLAWLNRLAAEQGLLERPNRAPQTQTSFYEQLPSWLKRDLQRFGRADAEPVRAEAPAAAAAPREPRPPTPQSAPPPPAAQPTPQPTVGPPAAEEQLGWLDDLTGYGQALGSMPTATWEDPPTMLQIDESELVEEAGPQTSPAAPPEIKPRPTAKRDKPKPVKATFEPPEPVETPAVDDQVVVDEQLVNEPVVEPVAPSTEQMVAEATIPAADTNAVVDASEAASSAADWAQPLPIPEDPDEAIAWLERMAREQPAADEDELPFPAPPVQPEDDVLEPIDPLPSPRPLEPAEPLSAEMNDVLSWLESSAETREAPIEAAPSEPPTLVETTHPLDIVPEVVPAPPSAPDLPPLPDFVAGDAVEPQATTVPEMGEEADQLPHPSPHDADTLSWLEQIASRESGIIASLTRQTTAEPVGSPTFDPTEPFHLERARAFEAATAKQQDKAESIYKFLLKQPTAVPHAVADLQKLSAEQPDSAWLRKLLKKGLKRMPSSDSAESAS